MKQIMLKSALTLWFLCQLMCPSGAVQAEVMKRGKTKTLREVSVSLSVQSYANESVADGSIEEHQSHLKSMTILFIRDIRSRAKSTQLRHS